MIGIHRRLRPEPETDMQSRLRHIERRCEEIRGGNKRPPSKEEGVVAELAYLVSYLAGIVEKHLREDAK